MGLFPMNVGGGGTQSVLPEKDKYCYMYTPNAWDTPGGCVVNSISGGSITVSPASSWLNIVTIINTEGYSSLTHTGQIPLTIVKKNLADSYMIQSRATAINLSDVAYVIAIQGTSSITYTLS